MSVMRLVAIMACVTAATAQTTYQVSPGGEINDTTTIAEALANATGGDTVYLNDGVYDEPIITTAAGSDGSPLTIEGGPNAVVNGATGDRDLLWSQKVVDIRHSWITLRGFTVDGKIGEAEEEESYSDKCVMVEGNANEAMSMVYQDEAVETILIGFVMEDMIIKNCGLECVRMRNFVTHATISNNEITDCGIWDFNFRNDGGKTGDAIQIGTADNQWKNGTWTTNGADGSNNNLVVGNTLTPNGNECVETKEGSSFNIIEDNHCSEQHDVDSGCFSMRGSFNIIRNNIAENCAGAGIRLGGNFVDDVVWGVENEVYGNEFRNTGTQRNATGEGGGSVVSLAVYQAQVCENVCVGDFCDPKEKSKCNEQDTCDDQVIDFTIGWTWDQPCDDTAGYIGCFVQEERAGILGDFDSSADAMNNEVCLSKCVENELVATMGEECWCGVETSYAFLFSCEEDNDGEECDDDPCFRMFDRVAE